MPVPIRVFYSKHPNLFFNQSRNSDHKRNLLTSESEYFDSERVEAEIRWMYTLRIDSFDSAFIISELIWNTDARVACKH